jgi:hypothetical protein
MKPSSANMLGATSAHHNPPSRARAFVAVLNHPKFGRLLARAEIRPILCGRWEVEWNIGDWDRDMGLSGRWGTKREYLDDLSEVLQNTHKRIRGRADQDRFNISIDGAMVRWGNASGLNEKLAAELAIAICCVWKKLRDEWMQEEGRALYGSALFEFGRALLAGPDRNPTDKALSTAQVPQQIV